ncbi:GFA family protein [Hyphomicrobium sp. CS1GBMeth3]|uniref:GFA family protein n=1 Tax=Hyphomicrobium sp. CS1GBMeth3 TaxID=1892845 RepID=UPI000A4DC634|nr:GFA family protein [Hyphomicrobium sp. CS1GBMeth3]
MTEARDITGHCLCGAVSYATKTTTHEVHACHCGMCRRWTGGPLMYFDCEGMPSITGQEFIGVYRSSDVGERGFCTRCGTVLFWKVAGEERYTFTAGSVDDVSGFTFTRQIFIEDKPPYYDFANETEKVRGSVAMASYTGDAQKTE